ncbi:unnamed protein product [Auanema sp. JU1783]|nr:unnamed protein product [Auanema sp. JU1783]
MQNLGLRKYIAFTYIGFNIVGFIVNIWVFYVVAPLIFAPAVKVPKSILFFIMALCVGDLMTMIAMLLLVMELFFGTWQFSSVVCTSYLVFDSMNKFIAPMIVFLISRTCYATICLNKTKAERAASLKYAVVQLAVALGFVLVLVWPVFAYSQVFTFYINPNSTTKEVTIIRKCGFFPPQQIEFWFNLIACITSYAVPLIGIIYSYLSVPFFLKRRALTTLVSSNSIDNAMRKVITTVLLLTAIYVLCWSPYWVSMFAHDILPVAQKYMVIISYFIHLLPYVSCLAYPVIFTLMNRGIRTAHAKIVADQRRRFRSLTDDATVHVRSVIRGFPQRLRQPNSNIQNDPKSTSSDSATRCVELVYREKVPDTKTYSTDENSGYGANSNETTREIENETLLS